LPLLYFNNTKRSQIWFFNKIESETTIIALKISYIAAKLKERAKNPSKRGKRTSERIARGRIFAL